MGLEKGANDEEEGTHANGRNEQGQLTSQGLDQEEHEEGRGNELDNAVHTGRQEGVRVAGVANLPGTSVRFTWLWKNIRSSLTDWKICGA